MVRLEGVCYVCLFRIPTYKMRLLLRDMAVLGSRGVWLIWMCKWMKQRQYRITELLKLEKTFKF